MEEKVTQPRKIRNMAWSAKIQVMYKSELQFVPVNTFPIKANFFNGKCYENLFHI